MAMSSLPVTPPVSARKEKDEEKGVKETPSVGGGESTAAEAYTEQEYRALRKKMDRYLLPLMWLCYGIQQTDKTSLGTQATFGLREDTGLVGQQYAWLTTVFYMAYLCFEFPSTFVLQRYLLGRTLSVFMICWGMVVFCIAFARNWTHLMLLRALQGAFECCISPGFILLVGAWYRTEEHASRMLVFQSANAGFSIVSSLVLYGIGSVDSAGFQTWRGMSYFLGGLTVLVGFSCLFVLGTPSEVGWLTAREKDMARTRTLKNNTGHDRTGHRSWDWGQVVECCRDPVYWFSLLNAFLGAVPNGGLTTFGAIVQTSFGFSNLRVILLEIPRHAVSVIIFLVVGLVTVKWKDVRMYFMMAGLVPAVIGFCLMAFMPTGEESKWRKWGGYFMTVTFVLPAFLGWSLVPSNIAGRTKRWVLTSTIFLGYCVGNMVGAQIFRSEDAPQYMPGIVGCIICFGLQFVLVLAWKLLYVWRNRRNDGRQRADGISDEERAVRAKALGEQDVSDLANPWFRYST